jgi:hypothetical protein
VFPKSRIIYVGMQARRGASMMAVTISDMPVGIKRSVVCKGDKPW